MFFEDQDVVKGMQAAVPLYADQYVYPLTPGPPHRYANNPEIDSPSGRLNPTRCSSSPSG